MERAVGLDVCGPVPNSPVLRSCNGRGGLCTRQPRKAGRRGRISSPLRRGLEGGAVGVSEVGAGEPLRLINRRGPGRKASTGLPGPRFWDRYRACTRPRRRCRGGRNRQGDVHRGGRRHQPAARALIADTPRGCHVRAKIELYVSSHMSPHFAAHGNVYRMRDEVAVPRTIAREVARDGCRIANAATGGTAPARA